MLLETGEDIIVSYGLKTHSIYMDNKFTVLKYLECYRKLYYNEGKRKDEVIWLTTLTSATFE